eukprot:12902490-Ditylum_brightwellii.AAC.1
MTVDGGDTYKYVLRLSTSIYGLRQSSLNWFKLLFGALQKKGRDFKPSQVDPCLFIRKDIVVLTYVDDVLIIGTTKQSISGFIKSLKEGYENFEFTEEGTVENYLGVMIRRFIKNNNRSFELCQLFLIKKFVELVGLTETVGGRDTPVGLPLLYKDLKCLKRKQSWNYSSALGMSSNIQGSTRPETSMDVHQCARFTNEPMLSHERDIMRIAKYLARTTDRGVVYNPHHERGIECYVDADFAGSWSKADADNPEN